MTADYPQWAADFCLQEKYRGSMLALKENKFEKFH